MFVEFIEKLIHRLGRQGYKIDKAISTRELAVIVAERGWQLVRGLFSRFFFGKVEGFIFLGRRTRLTHKHKIFFGKNPIIGDGVEINALSKAGAHFGDNVTLKRDVIIDCSGVIRNIGSQLTVGDRVGFSQRCYIQVSGDVTIGDDVIFGPSAKIFSENHRFDDPNKPFNQQGEVQKGVVIGKGTWIGAGAIILDGVVLGDNCVVAAGAVVTKSVPAQSVVAGVPAKITRNLAEIER